MVSRYHGYWVRSDVSNPVVESDTQRWSDESVKQAIIDYRKASKWVGSKTCEYAALALLDDNGNYLFRWDRIHGEYEV